MNLPNVRISQEKSQKYIVAKVAGNPELMLWGDPNATWHSDIKAEMRDAGLIIEEMRGGGRIKLIESKKTIYVWDKSTVNGPASFPEVKKILETVYTGYNIVNEIPSVK